MLHFVPTYSDLLNPQLPVYCIIYPTQLAIQASKLFFFCFRADSFLPANRVKFYSIVCTGTVLIRIHLLLIKDGLRYDQDPFFSSNQFVTSVTANQPVSPYPRVLLFILHSQSCPKFFAEVPLPCSICGSLPLCGFFLERNNWCLSCFCHP